jgi:M6 family metalloprotease-like protein
MLAKTFRRVLKAVALPLGLALFLGFAATTSHAAYLRNVPITLAQPDGETLSLFASGDEHYNWLHDQSGYVILQNQAGVYVYGRLEDGRIVGSNFRVNTVAPDSVGLTPNIKPDVATLKAKIDASLAQQQLARANASPTTGTVNNLVVFIRFSDQSEFTSTSADFDTIFNASATGATSLYAYYREVSYQQLSISSTYYPSPGATVLSYQDSNPRNYYRIYNASTNPTGYATEDERRVREHALLANALNAVKSGVPVGLNIDGDNDGLVDSVSFIVRGGSDAWNNLLWPHMWSLSSETVTINGKTVYAYMFVPESNYSTVCHEMFHILGAPDLYRYTNTSIDPVDEWDLMASTTTPSQHMGAYMKTRYGRWISSIPSITSSGTYTLNPVASSTNNAYKIASPNSETQYFVLEYRRATGVFESGLPGTGLLVYRINTAADNVGNANGPPDEVYVYRPGGTTSINGTAAQAFFSQDAGRTSINDSTSPSSFLASGAAGGLNISNVGLVGETISFTVTLQNALPVNLSFSNSGDKLVWFAEDANSSQRGGAFDVPANWRSKQ